MLIPCTTGATNDFIFKIRYNEINKYDILDHQSNILTTVTGVCFVGDGGTIILSGITYPFKDMIKYTLKCYYLYQNEYYLAHQSIVFSNQVTNNIIKQNNKYVNKTR